ncbi:hypothetical protein GOP47_0003914 [Adiantum capillus-veneris]|uniref:PIFI-like Ig-like domain-containing protein n=1 Tax=Adiantum capillus-veneris TaxID=13818 RepID=A0A9D4V6I7_ADICA|nr:hypothetical protein GOP47_0003914 [Adiantum capillus-veneris]
MDRHAMWFSVASLWSFCTLVMTHFDYSLYRSRFTTNLLTNSSRKGLTEPGKAYATATVTSEKETYTLPQWSDFEMGFQPVFWETKSGEAPTSGEEVTIFFNPTASKLVPNMDYGIAFNGGFNQPIMCGGEPRIMTRRDRGPACAPFFSIKINVPVHALTLEFSFTDGKVWDGPYKLKFEIPKRLKNQPLEFFNKGLAEELSKDGACDSAIYPDAAFIESRCLFPASLIHEGGDRCDLDIFPGCMDPDSPNYDPLATIDDGSCPYISDESSDED